MRIFIIIAVAALLGAIGFMVARHFSRPPAVQGVEVYAAKTETQDCLDHSAYDGLLKKFVKDGRVNYAGLKTEQQTLKSYLDAVAKVDQKSCARDGLLAMYINAYNAATLELIVEHYPGIKSIKDIPSADRWDARRWTVAGELLSLSDLEHNVLRKRFVEPRVHFAINCASASCPPLRPEAYTAARIAQQLQEQAEFFNRAFGGAKWNAKEKKLTLSKIYDWYNGDFTGNAPLPAYVSTLAEPAVAAEIKAAGVDNVTVEFQNYDWSLNGQ
jgi:hypothetical protein